MSDLRILRIAVIADVHANIWALDAVLQDIERRGISRILNLGDCIFGPLDPVATAERLNQKHIATIAGNCDDILLRNDDVGVSLTYDFVKDRLTSEHLKWLYSFPFTYVDEEDIFCCHGTPASNETSLLEEVTPAGLVLASTEQIAHKLQGISYSVIVCGHTHIPRTVWLSDGRLVVNPGSVGVPAFDGDDPYPHKVETGSPHARYAVLSKSARGWEVEHCAIPYDWDLAAEVAHRHGRDDYAHYLKYGRAGFVTS